ncbi:hypothetical protein ACQP2P_05560 [Dactylosporangium sp. CA-139114]|uniref:hypothetical protein n=1 Tax=Dactylosporangium sp. CA-139114 TaxID=3239931 RepID=UPI003D9700F9
MRRTSGGGIRIKEAAWQTAAPGGDRRWACGERRCGAWRMATPMRRMKDGDADAADAWEPGGIEQNRAERAECGELGYDERHDG